jgi:dolichyl-phosphate-mannose-protein mannosyltransferase
MKWWLVVLILGAVTHLLFLSWPDQVVFDEVHFGKFVTAYCCTGERFFDIHPPHAKLLIAGVAYLGGYRGGLSFEYIGQAYGDVPVAALRFLPAVTGVLLAVVMTRLLRQLGASPWLAWLGGVVVAVDNALIVQTRLIALDGVLLVSTMGALSAYLASVTTAGYRLLGWSLLAGALAGLAVGTKFTGLAIVVLLGILMLARLLQERTWRTVRHLLLQGVSLVVGFAIIYLAGWALHFALLTQPGSGDVWGVPQFESPVAVSFVRETIKLHRTMLDANYNLTATHPYASTWWTWPLMLKPVFYWQGADNAALYFIGNPVVWWGAAVLTGMALLGFLYRVLQAGGFFGGAPLSLGTYRLWIPWLGFIITLVPLTRIPRALFMYHYLSPLLFSILISILYLDRWLPANKRRTVAVLGAVVASVGWLLVSPITYGFTVSTWWHSLVQWFI